MSSTGSSTRSSLEISLRSGAVRVHVADVAAPVVTRGRATIDDEGVVHARESSAVEIACPAGTNVFAATASGSVTCTGALGSVRITTSSGHIRVEQCTDADLRTSSGKVVVGIAEQGCRIIGSSGRIEIASAPVLDLTTSSGRVTCGGVRDAVVHGASGSVHLTCAEPGDVDIRTMSGRVTVACAGGWAPARELTGRGRVKDQLPPATGEGRVTIRTLSGGIELRPA